LKTFRRIKNKYGKRKEGEVRKRKEGVDSGSTTVLTVLEVAERYKAEESPMFPENSTVFKSAP
jgi:hypothetical protein